MSHISDKDLRVLFVGLGNSRVAWYRCVLPALYLGCDFMGMVGQPPKSAVVTSYVQGNTQVARFEDYDVIILQQSRGRGWFKIINNLRAAGKIVLYEIDDYVHGIRKATDHDFKEFFTKAALKDMELCMRACDGMVCSTEYIAQRYRSHAKRSWVCKNGLDMARYRLTAPERSTIKGQSSVTLMWSGATGHYRGALPWLAMVDRVLLSYPHVCFASIGQDFASILSPSLRDRVTAIPFSALETYPSAMMVGDIALAPAGQSAWYRAKSGLRAMESAALGIPVVADDHYADEIKHGDTGFIAHDVADAEEHVRYLIETPAKRREMGDHARVHAANNFDMVQRREQWREAILEAFCDAN